MKLAAQIGATVSALLGGAVVTLSYGHLLWANALLSWIPVLLVLSITGPPAAPDRGKKPSAELRQVLSSTLVGDAATRLAFLNLVASGAGGLVTLGQVGRGLGGVLFLHALNEKISSAFRATVISMANLGTRASFCLLGPLVGYGIDRWGLPSVLSSLGILFSIAFVCLLLPLAPRERALRPEAEPRLP